MQTFLPYADFQESAYALDPKRLGKQRVETLQIMQALFNVRMITSESIFTGEFEEENLDGQSSITKPKMQTVYLPRESWRLEPVENPAWGNHPVLKMWMGHEWMLLQYQKACFEAWTEGLGYNDTCFQKTLWLYFRVYRGEDDHTPPPWLGDEDFHRSHQSNLIRKDPEYYKKQFPGVPDDLPYIWPTSMKEKS